MGARLAAAPLPQLRPYQLEAGRAIARSVLRGEGRSFSIEIARQGGKNELSAQLEMYLLLLHANRAIDAVKCAPTFMPQARISMRRLWSRLEDAGLAPPARIEEGHAVCMGRARQLFLSAEPGANVVGHTAGLLLEVDEAQDVDPERFDLAFRPMAAAASATIVYYGTPWGDTTLLARAKQHHLELERRDGLRRHYAFDWRAVAAHQPAYARFVEGERERLGEDHPLFRTQYLLEPLAGDDRLFPPRLRAMLEGGHPRLVRPGDAEDTYVGGLDLAGEAAPGSGARRDATVLTIGRVRYPGDGPLAGEPHVEVVETVAWTGASYDALYAELATLLGDVWRIARIAIDATGLGGPAVRFLSRRLGDDRVEPVVFTAERKSELGYALLAAAHTGRLRLFAGDGSAGHRAIQHELERARVEYRPDRKMRFFVPENEGHDDHVVSLALLMAAAQTSRPAAERVARGRPARPGGFAEHREIR